MKQFADGANPEMRIFVAKELLDSGLDIRRTFLFD